MRIPRIYIDQALASGAIYRLPDTAAHHFSHVLRMQAGQPLIIFNGLGGYYEGVLHRADKRSVEIETGCHHIGDNESPLNITLVQGISRGERMDYTLQKAVELGVTQIVPVLCEYTNVRLDDVKKIKRHEHWRKIIINACEQCGRNRLPALLPVQDLDAWVQMDQNDLKLILHPSGGLALAQISEPRKNVTLLAGPEGGFSDAEVICSKKHQYQAVVLGPRILRTETAALAAISICQTLWGDFR